LGDGLADRCQRFEPAYKLVHNEEGPDWPRVAGYTEPGCGLLQEVWCSHNLESGQDRESGLISGLFARCEGDFENEAARRIESLPNRRAISSAAWSSLDRLAVSSEPKSVGWMSSAP